MGARMIRRLLPIALIVTGCSQASNHENEGSGASSPPARVTAVLSCTVNGTPIGVSACFVGGGNTIGGSLKISSAGEVKQYTNYDLARENGRTFELPLTTPFRVTAQANSESAYVLRMEIQQGSKTVFQDEAAEFGVIDASDSSLR